MTYSLMIIFKDLFFYKVQIDKYKTYLNAQKEKKNSILLNM